jgi:hypothetical protein
MSLCKSLSGRKKDCSLGILSKEKSVCCVVNEKTGENCNAEISGKNPTNLKRHLQAFHKEANEIMKTGDGERELTKKKKNDTEDVRNSQTIVDCLRKNKTSWPVGSVEHMSRQNAMVDMVIDSACPVNFVNNTKFKEFCSSLDHSRLCNKASLPGKLALLHNLEF